MGKLVAMTYQRGTNMRISSGEPRATAAPGSSCCSNTHAEAQRTASAACEAAHGPGTEPAPVLVHLHKCAGRQSDLTQLWSDFVAAIPQHFTKLAWLSITTNVGSTYLVLHLPGLHVNISI